MASSVRLKKFQQVELADGRTVTVVDKLGEGGQGVVYRVKFDDTGEEKALKWYFVSYFKEPKKFYNHLEENIKVGAPSAAFIWPEQLTKWIDGESFGYIMEIFPKGYESFSKFLNAKVSFKSVKAMVNAGLNMVAAFKALHNKGYNYQDLNDGNFSINPATGKVLICDNDNVVGHGEHSGISGKARYMAPEVVRGDKAPDKNTDKYSLAVVLFMLLVGDHPLEGKMTNVPALTDKYDKRFFGEKPLFIFDKNDNSNAPVPGLHQNAVTMWKYFPSFVKEAFQQSFSQESLLNMRGRLLEQDWFNILMRLKSSIVRCPQCGEEIFLESDRETICNSHKIKPVGYLNFTRRSNQAVTVPIFKDAVLYDYHVSGSEDFETVAAVILEKPGKFGLENKSSKTWFITLSNGKSVTKKPGEVLGLGVDSKIDFGNNIVATVVAN